MRISLATVPIAVLLAVLMTLHTRIVAADDDTTGADSLTISVFDVDPWNVAVFRRGLDSLKVGADLLQGPAGDDVGNVLFGDEQTCRTNLQRKLLEPGSPWLTWTHVATMRVDSCTWFAGALSCTDSMCGETRVRHDRLALLVVAPRRNRIFVVPAEAATIGDNNQTSIDSIAFLVTGQHMLIQARSTTSNDHPCWVGNLWANEHAAFALARGDSVVQAFQLEVSSESMDHDDVNGDSGTTVTSVLRVTADSIRLDRKTEDWKEASEDGLSAAARTSRDEVIRLRLDARSGRFVSEQ